MCKTLGKKHMHDTVKIDTIVLGNVGGGGGGGFAAVSGVSNIQERVWLT